MYQHIKTILTHGLSQPIFSNSIKIALVVGTILNAVNQGERIIAGSEIFWGSLFLNYLIPFCVSCYSASRHAMHQVRHSFHWRAK
jgi:hypothetical protein